MLIVEHFLLIACDPREGMPMLPAGAQRIGVLAAAALLLELAAQHRLEIRDTCLHADASMPLSHTLLTEALRALAARPLPTRTALEHVEHKLDSLVEHVLDGMARRDLLHRYVQRRWLLWRQQRYPLRSVQARNEALERLRHGLHDDTDLHGLALLLLADVGGVLAQHIDASEHALAAQRLRALTTESADTARAVYASVRAASLR